MATFILLTIVIPEKVQFLNTGTIGPLLSERHYNNVSAIVLLSQWNTAEFPFVFSRYALTSYQDE